MLQAERFVEILSPVAFKEEDFPVIDTEDKGE